VSSPHRAVNPPTLAPPVGFAHAVVAAPGSLVFLGGQGPLDGEGAVSGDGVAEQFERAVENVVEALRASGARPEHLVSLQIFVTDVEEYAAALGEIGEAYRRHLGRHYPAIALFGVGRLLEPRAKVELVGTAVVPSSGAA
jgi:enamine deaminase RidA (YjgF/YER057c/UK114 family)